MTQFGGLLPACFTSVGGGLREQREGVGEGAHTADSWAGGRVDGGRRTDRGGGAGAWGRTGYRGAAGHREEPVVDRGVGACREGRCAGTVRRGVRVPADGAVFLVV